MPSSDCKSKKTSLRLNARLRSTVASKCTLLPPAAGTFGSSDSLRTAGQGESAAAKRKTTVGRIHSERGGGRGGEGLCVLCVMCVLCVLCIFREMEGTLRAASRSRAAHESHKRHPGGGRRCRGGGGSRRRLARFPRRLARARRGVFRTVTSATSPWAMCDASMGHVRRFHVPCATLPWATGGWLHEPCATAPWAMCDGSMGHRRLASCRVPRRCRLSTPPSSRDGGVE